MHFTTNSSGIKTWRLGIDMSPLSNVNYYKIKNAHN